MVISGGSVPPLAPLDSDIPEITSQALHNLDLCIVGINFAPEPTGIAPYTTGMAEHLGSRAHSVTVLTGIPHYPHWTVSEQDRHILRRQEIHPQGFVVRRFRHVVPARQTAVRRAAYEATFLGNAGVVRLKNSPQLIIAVTPSLSGALLGARLARRYKARLLVVVQDLMAKAAAQSGMSGGSRVARITAELERRALTRADRVAVVSEAFRDTVHQYGIPEHRISTLPNWTHIESVTVGRDHARTQLGWPTDTFIVVHTGNIGLKQDLGNVVEAARLSAGDAGLQYIIVGDGNQRAAIQEQAVGLTNISFVDPVSTEEYPLVLRAADVLVVNERGSVGDMSLPSKLTSYLSAARPILAAVGEDGATSQELSRANGAALRIDPGDPLRFADAVRELRTDPARRRQMSEQGLRYAQSTLGADVAMGRLEEIILETMGT